MARATVVAQGKGRVGKTPTTTHTAAHQGAAKFGVLAIDLDPQGLLGVDLEHTAAGLSSRGGGSLTAALTKRGQSWRG